MPGRAPDQRILGAARACIARVGVAKTTLDDVAREAGCARATLYRYFPNKLQLLAALVARDAAVTAQHAVDAANATEDLEAAAVAIVTTAAHEIESHPALAFVRTHEPELLLPYLAFEREDAVLRAAGALVAPAFERFVGATAERLAEWLARITFSYLCAPSADVDLADPASVAALVRDFVLPAFTPDTAFTIPGRRSR